MKKIQLTMFFFFSIFIFTTSFSFSFGFFQYSLCYEREIFIANNYISKSTTNLKKNKSNHNFSFKRNKT